MTKRFPVLLARACCVLALSLWAHVALADKRVALVIGNAGYKNINPLVNPLHDAPDFAEALRKLGFDVILRPDADKGGFDRALAEFARKATGADAALFYYAGHGIQYQKQNYLLPVDIDVEDYNDVEFRAVNVASVMQALERSQGVRIVVLDACRNNPLDKKLSTASRSAGPVSRGLAKIDKAEGMVVAYATASDQVAQDGSGRNSPFTEALIARLAEPGLEVATLFRRVTQDVFERTAGQQRPEISISLLGDYFLNKAETDADVWPRVRDGGDPAELRKFIVERPGSIFAPDARFRLEMFAKMKKERDNRAMAGQMRAPDAAPSEYQREEDRLAVARLALRRQDVAVAGEREEQPAGPSLADMRLEVERLAALKRSGPPPAAGPEDEELKRLIAARKLAGGSEAERMDAAIRVLVRKAVQRQAMARRQAAEDATER